MGRTPFTCKGGTHTEGSGRAAGPREGGQGWAEGTGQLSGAGREEGEAGVLKLKPKGPLGCRDGGTAKEGEEHKERNGGVTCSWRRVYCQDVTPGAFSMKRRALVMRKLACWERKRCSLNPPAPEKTQALRFLFLCPLTPRHWLAHSGTTVSTNALTRAGPKAPPLPSPLLRRPISRTRTTGMAQCSITDCTVNLSLSRAVMGRDRAMSRHHLQKEVTLCSRERPETRIFTEHLH